MRIIKRNNHGFSLVELLAVIVILGVISTVGIVAVSKLIEKSKANYYISQKNTLLMAGQAYYTENKGQLPKEYGGIKKVTSEKLIEENYLEDNVKDDKGKICQKAYVSVLKKSKNDYQYVAVLNCNTEISNEIDEEYPTPEITIDESNVSKITGNEIKDNSLDMNFTIKPYAGYDSSNDPNTRIASYSYKIYADGVVKLNSGNIAVKNTSIKVINSKDLGKAISFEEYVPAKVKLSVTATNTYGKTVTKSTRTYDFKDLVSPICGTRITYEAGDLNQSKKCGEGSNNWVGLNTTPNYRSVMMNCEDKKGVGCAKPVFSRTFTSEEGEWGFITMYDQKNNAQNCKVKTCVDKTSPKVVIKVYNATSDGKKGSTLIQSFESTPAGNEKKNSTATYSTNWVNSAYPYGAYIEVTASDPKGTGVDETSKASTITWSRAGTAITPSKSSSGTGFVAGAANTNQGNNINQIEVKDNAGNKTTITLNTYIDTVAPGCTTTTSNSNWTKDNVTITGTCSDATSGCESANVTKVFSSNTNSNQSPGSVKDKAGNSKTCDTIAVKVDKCTQMDKEFTYGDWSKWSACTKACKGTQTATADGVKRSTFGSTFVCDKDTKSKSQSCGTDCPPTTYKIYTCRSDCPDCSCHRTGNTCIHNTKNKSSCDHSVGYNTELSIVKVDDYWGEIQSGTHKGRYIKYKCTRESKTCCTSDSCKG